MENETNSIASLIAKAGDYLETRVELAKLQAVDKVSGIASSMISVMIMVIVVGLMLFCLNIGIAVWLGELLGEVYYGFFIVSGFYLLLAILLYLLRHTWLRKVFRDSIVKKVLG